MFVIKNEKTYIGMDINNRPKTVNRIEEALQFDRKDRADNYLANISATLRHLRYSVESVADPANIPAENRARMEKLLDIDDTCTRVKDMEILLSDMLGNKMLLEQELASCEKEIQDVLHAAEFYKLNASQGYKLYSILHDIRSRRRKCKDMLRIIDNTFRVGVCDIATGTVSRDIDRMESRMYKPRVLQELFSAEEGADGNYN
jgi:hypothetical protein